MYDILKRTTDILSALFVITLFSPLLLLIALAIKLDSPGPCIYKQRRVGKDGKIFFIWKFRSMFDNVDKMLAKDREFMKNFKKKEGWKLPANQDPRITRVGRFIRKYSLDELPNLWNILAGDMSMVGPRAYRNDDIFGDEIAQQLKFFPGLKKELDVALSVKPGLTGPWQTSGRNAISWDRRVALDAAYARNKSIWRDFVIVLKTPLAMFNKW
ncbi:sugar transferase [Patescibacteria group bacterium]|nr:sugar transferase [Patescibacteria group bacterium]